MEFSACGPKPVDDNSCVYTVWVKTLQIGFESPSLALESPSILIGVWMIDESYLTR